MHMARFFLIHEVLNVKWAS